METNDEIEADLKTRARYRKFLEAKDAENRLMDMIHTLEQENKLIKEAFRQLRREVTADPRDGSWKEIKEIVLSVQVERTS
jgi:hypothetical protein